MTDEEKKKLEIELNKFIAELKNDNPLLKEESFRCDYDLGVTPPKLIKFGDIDTPPNVAKSIASKFIELFPQDF